MNPITIPNITIPTIGLPTIGIPSVGFPSASGGGLVWPKGLKESIKAIYDPASQGMTNYDVIEAYVEDFTYWTLDNTGITSTPKKIVIPTGTELKYVIAFRGFNNFTAGFDIKYTGNAVITYRYNKEDGTVGTIAINKSGIYHLPASVRAQKNFGFYCNPQTVTEEATIEQLPTSILKDLSGNGNHAYLYGGKGKLNSGMGLYKVDYTTYNNSGNQNVTDIKPNSFVLLAGALSRLGLPYSSIIGEYIPSYAIRIQGISGGTITYYYRNENGKQLTYVIDADGDYILPPCYSEGAEGTAVNIVSNNNINNVTITQIPDYPNQLCYDGKMYAVCYGFPILTDYTVMADRTWFVAANRFFISKVSSQGKNGAFTVEKSDTKYTFSYESGTIVPMNLERSIIVQTKTKYNNVPIVSGNVPDTNIFTIGGILEDSNRRFIGCHGKIIIADRSFTEDEITWLKDKFFTIDIPTPAYDFDFSKLKSGENTFTDKYGNELSLYNFAWNGMSGLGGYGIDVSEGLIQPNRFDYTYNNASKEFVFLKPLSDGTYLFNVKVNVVQSTQKIKFTNVNKPITFVRANTSNVYYTITKDGIYDIDFITDADTIIKENYVENEELNLKIQFLPTYPQALVFDGVDDYALLPSEASKLIKSVILDVVPLKFGAILYDQRKGVNNDDYQFAVYHGENTIAYSARNNGDTYIDGALNTTLIPARLTDRHMQIAITNNNVKDIINSIHIGCSITKSLYSPMALYRITGFTEVLTPDQIWKWYQKNQPKGGDK